MYILLYLPWYCTAVYQCTVLELITQNGESKQIPIDCHQTPNKVAKFSIHKFRCVKKLKTRINVLSVSDSHSRILYPWDLLRFIIDFIQVSVS